MARTGQSQLWRHVAAALGISLYLSSSDAEAQTSVEYAVKAAYLVKIAPFIEWPPAAFASPTAPLNICVLGHDPFGGTLDRAASGQQDNGRSIEVRRIGTPDSSCQILYFQGSVDQEAALSGKPVLTVTDGVPSAHAGMFNFLVANNHVGFEIDRDAANQAGIKISSKLLQLATNVRGGP
jgi:hypothetical protein